MDCPVNENDKNEDKLPQLVSGKQFIYKATNFLWPVLGICRDAQLIAGATYTKMYCNTMKKIGKFPIFEISLNDSLLFVFKPPVKVFQCHGETFLFCYQKMS
jgi:GMP synthase-like glutamine amidotransferase